MAVPYLERAVARGAGRSGHSGALYGGLAGLGQDKRKAFELYNKLQSSLTRGASQACIILHGVPKNEDVARQIMKVVFNKDGISDPGYKHLLLSRLSRLSRLSCAHAE